MIDENDRCIYWMAHACIFCYFNSILTEGSLCLYITSRDNDVFSQKVENYVLTESRIYTFASFIAYDSDHFLNIIYSHSHAV